MSIHYVSILTELFPETIHPPLSKKLIQFLSESLVGLLRGELQDLQK